MRKALSVGMAIGRDSISSTWRVRGDRQYWRTSLATGRGITPCADATRAAFEELATRIPLGAPVSLAIAILPPIARIRRIELPPMGDDERRAAIARAAERHFVGLSKPVVCAVERRDRSGPVVSFLAAAVSADIISNLEQLASELGWTIDRVLPAHSAWVVASKTQSPACGDWKLLARGADETTMLVVCRGRLAMTHRLRPTDLPPADAIILDSQSSSVEMLAAHGAMKTRSLELVSDHARLARTAMAVRLSRWLGIAAAVFVMAGGWVYWYGVSRELAMIARQRAAIRAQVSLAVVARDTLEQLRHSIDAIQSLERSSVLWSVALSRISIALPRDASLIALRADGDSVSLDGRATDAAATFAAVRSVPGVARVRAAAPLRRDFAVGKQVVERWAVVVRFGRVAERASRE